VSIETAQALMKLYGEPSLECMELSCWLVDVLQNTLLTNQKSQWFI